MRQIVTTTTIPDRKLRKAIGVGPDAVLLLESDGLNVVTGEHGQGLKVLGPKTLARRLGIKLAGAELRWHGQALAIIRVESDRTGYDN